MASERSDPRTALASRNWAWRALDRLGAGGIESISEAAYLTSLMYTVLLLSVRPSCWRRTIRKAFAHKLLAVGAETIAPLGLVAFLVGILVVMQAQLWLSKVGQTQLLGPLLVVVVVRELAPLLTNLVMILRSGSEMTVDLANMTQAGQVRMLDAQGIDPLVYLVMPRVAAMAVSALCLMLLFIIFSFISGYLCSFALGFRVAAPVIFLNQVLRALQSKDVLNLLASGLIPSVLTALICCSQGLSVPQAGTAVPLATRRALSHSVVGLFLVSVPASIITYL